MFNRNRKSKDAIIPYSPKIRSDISTDLLNKMRDSQQISNYEYMMLGLQVEILNKLNSIDVSAKSTAVSNEFLGRYMSNKFKWF